MAYRAGVFVVMNYVVMSLCAARCGERPRRDRQSRRSLSPSVQQIDRVGSVVHEVDTVGGIEHQTEQRPGAGR